MDLADALFREAKKKAAEEGRPLRRVVEDALRVYLDRPSAREVPYKLEFPVVQGRILPGVDLSDRDALYDLMEGRR